MLKKISMKQLKWIFIIFLMVGFSQFGMAQSQLSKKQAVKFENLGAKDFYEKFQQTPEAQLIDVRTPAEYRQGHLPHAVLINYYDRNFAANLEKAGFDKNKPVFIYCRSGHRSGNARKIFLKLGFSHVINLAHGINEWYQLNLPIEK